jgi:poly-gamma-glutamate synthesis protein (capsule biosynthesis protein)
MPQSTATPSNNLKPIIYVSDSVPQKWQNSIARIPGVTVSQDKHFANLVFEPIKSEPVQPELFKSTLVYAAVAPFFTVTDGLSESQFMALWDGLSDDLPFKNIVVSDNTAQVITDVWGGRGGNVRIAAEESLLTIAEENPGTIAIIPFDALTPRWKVLKIDGLSPLDKPLEITEYPLAIDFYLYPTSASNLQNSTIGESFKTLLPETNRDEARMTVLIMTGTTALTRGTAYKIEKYGTDYPIEEVKEWFLSADLRHVSNEIPFVEDCPPGDIYATSLQFCASPGSIEVLEKIGINVVELTGNHENDYGRENFAKTIEEYKKRGWLIYGGGLTEQAAKQAVTTQINGNRIAFIGCNYVGPVTVWANEDAPGAAECDFDYMTAWITKLKEFGYVVITTFQHQESLMYRYNDKYSDTFKVMAEAGADIVQGSQSHFAMSMEFVGNSFIHYGLGNFLFDQMDYEIDGQRREFINRHIIYNGKYVNTELLTALLEDYARPTPMTESKRAEFLEIIFNESQ